MPTLTDQLSARIGDLDRPTLERLAHLCLGKLGSYLPQHAPGNREKVGRFACSGKTSHIPPCGNYSSDGDCEPGELEEWCPASGFDCPDCALFDELERILYPLKVPRS